MLKALVLPTYVSIASSTLNALIRVGFNSTTGITAVLSKGRYNTVPLELVSSEEFTVLRAVAGGTVRE